MNFWWENQGKSWEQEIKGGFMWSPKRKRNGHYNQFFENMKYVEAGDYVFSYSEQQIRYIGKVLSTAISGDKPKGFHHGEEWTSDGWLIRVDFVPVPIPLQPKRIIDKLLPFLPEKYSPLGKNGKGLQVYLTGISEGMARILLEYTGYKE